jgi:hypothetical protein
MLQGLADALAHKPVEFGLLKLLCLSQFRYTTGQRPAARRLKKRVDVATKRFG